MGEQLSMMVLVLALASGLLTSVVTASYMQTRQPVFFRYLLTNILLFNMLILSGMVWRYLQLPLQAADLRHYQVVLPGLLVLMAALKIGWLYVFIFMNKTLPADIQPKKLSAILKKTGLAIFMAYAGLMTVATYGHLGGLQQFAIIALETIIIVGAVMTTINLIKTAIRLPKEQRRRSILIFGFYHLGLMVIVLAVLILGWFESGPQRSLQLIVNGGFLTLYNLFPLIWLRWFQPVEAASGLEKFELLGITRREREIIKLIQAGKTNQEIADSLFISIATVKDHNHNIFKKCATRNRLELAKLFQ